PIPYRRPAPHGVPGPTPMEGAKHLLAMPAAREARRRSSIRALLTADGWWPMRDRCVPLPPRRLVRIADSRSFVTIGPRSREPLFRVPWLLARRPRIQRIPREANRAGAQPPPFARALPQFAPRVSECGQRLLPSAVPTQRVRP